MTDEDRIDRITVECWNRALDAFGYAYIYKRRISKIEPWQRWSKIVGILAPVSVGGIYAAYSTDVKLLAETLSVAAFVGLAQLIISTYLTIAGSDEKLNSYATLCTEYTILNSEFELLARFPYDNACEYQRKYEVALERERSLNRNDDLSDKELRRAMRAGLRNYRRACAGCGDVPVSMSSTNCDVCGKFKLINI